MGVTRVAIRINSSRRIAATSRSSRRKLASERCRQKIRKARVRGIRRRVAQRVASDRAQRPLDQHPSGLEQRHDKKRIDGDLHGGEQQIGDCRKD
jgi:hypothetical protein